MSDGLHSVTPSLGGLPTTRVVLKRMDEGGWGYYQGRHWRGMTVQMRLNHAWRSWHGRTSNEGLPIWEYQPAQVDGLVVQARRQGGRRPGPLYLRPNAHPSDHLEVNTMKAGKTCQILPGGKETRVTVWAIGT